MKLTLFSGDEEDVSVFRNFLNRPLWVTNIQLIPKSENKTNRAQLELAEHNRNRWVGLFLSTSEEARLWTDRCGDKGSFYGQTRHRTVVPFHITMIMHELLGRNLKARPAPTCGEIVYRRDIAWNKTKKSVELEHWCPKIVSAA